MSELYVVPFDDNDHNGRTTGDSFFSPELNVPYKEGMTVKDIEVHFLREEFADFIAEDGTLTEEAVEWGFKTIDDVVEGFGFHVTGGWVIEKRDLDIILSADVGYLGNDSALYMFVHTLKEQVQAASKFTIE